MSGAAGHAGKIHADVFVPHDVLAGEAKTRIDVVDLGSLDLFLGDLAERFEQALFPEKGGRS